MEEQQKNQKKSPVVAIVVGVILALVIVGGVAAVIGGSKDKETSAGDNTNRAEKSTDATPKTDCVDETGKAEATLVYDESENFVPSCIKISSGTTLTYRNDSDFALDVGADPHPTHSGNREVSKKEFELPVKPHGGTASTVMDKTGTFGLHNHENASATATVIVE